MRLRCERATFPLSDYDLNVKFGHLALRLTAYNGDVSGIIVAEHLFNNIRAARELELPFPYEEEAATENEIAPTGAVLRLGEAIRIGRRNPIQILDRRGSVDPDRHRLYDWRPFETLVRADASVSREHFQVTSMGAWVAEVQDLGSANGTVVEKVELTE